MAFIPREPPRYLQGQEAIDYLNNLERAYSNSGLLNFNNIDGFNSKRDYLLQKREELDQTGRIKIPTVRDVWERANRLISLVDQIKFE